jgi:hypothetical protein
MDMRLVAFALVPVLAACGSFSAQRSQQADAVQQSPAAAERLCTTAADRYNGRVVAAFAMTVDDVRAVMPTALPGGEDNYPEGWESLSGDVAAAKCYIDAEIAKAPPPGPEGASEPSFDRAVLFAAIGVDAAFYAAGYRDNLKPEPHSEDTYLETHAACNDVPESIRTECRGGIARSDGDNAETGRKFVPAPFAVKEVSGDRSEVTIVVAGIAGGCTGPARASVSETDDGLLVQSQVSVPDPDNVPCAASLPMRTVTVELPRPLRQDEEVRGECVPEDTTPEGRQCASTHAFATLPPP